MKFGNWNAKKLRRIVLIGAIAFVTAKVLFQIIGVQWAFLMLFALWISGHFVAWMKRHPPSSNRVD